MASASEETIGVLGMGAMGSGIAHNLITWARENHTKVFLWNRTASKAEEVARTAPDVATACETAEQVAQSASIVFLILFDGVQTSDVLSLAVLPNLRPNAVVVNCCTMGPSWAPQFVELAEHHQCHYLSAPVFGRPDAARAAKLIVVVSGPDAATKARVRPLFEAVGRAVLDVGADPGSANVLKLCGNLVIANCIEISSEAMAIANAHGIASDSVASFLKLMFANTPLAGYGALVASGQFDMSKSASPGFSVEGGLKDVTLMKAIKEEKGVYAPSVDILYKHLTEALARGLAHKEWSVISEVIKDTEP